MKRCLISMLALVTLLSLPFGALACSCAFKEQAGFIHASVEHLPSNARGALFLQPKETAGVILRQHEGIVIYGAMPRVLPPSSFTITSSVDEGPIPVAVTPLRLPGAAEGMAAPRAFRFVRAADQARYGDGSRPMDWQAMLRAGKLIDITARIGAAPDLVRIGPAGGFKPGARYTITYKGKAGNWRYPAKVEHAIDSEPVDLAGAAYALVLDGPVQRRALPVPEGGSCSALMPMIVQDFHYVIPAAQSRYANAMMYFSAIRDARANARFEQLEYTSSNCDVPALGATARGNGADMVTRQCSLTPGRVSIRGWAGLLEVEDRLTPTAQTEIDLDKATGSSCTKFGMLKEALASGDKERIEVAACSASQGQETPPAPGDLPATADLLTLAATGSDTARSCAKGALSALLISAPGHTSATLEQFGSLLASDMTSTDVHTARQARDTTETLVYRFAELAASDPQFAARSEKLLRPILPFLQQRLVSGTPQQTETAAFLIAGLGKDAAPLGPALLALAGGDGPPAGWAAHALTGIMPDDPRLHQILLRHAGIAALRNRAALDYSEVAGASDPTRAIALLAEAVRYGSAEAARKLESFGPSARSAVPALIGLLAKGGEAGNAAVSTLLTVAPADPEVLASFANSITARPEAQLYSSTLGRLAQLKKKGRALLPAIEERSKSPMSPGRKEALKEVVQSMGLPGAQARLIIAGLARAKTIDSDD